MAKIVIDGYNLLPTTDCRNRDSLLESLSAYRKRKHHQITIVFDGTHGGTGSGDHFHSGGIEVIFSPLTITADETIEDLLPHCNPGQTIVVSSDRRVQRAAENSGATFVSSQDFATRLTSRTPPRSEEEIPPWMEGRTEEDEARPKTKKGSARKLSKKERKRRRGLQKL